MIVEVECECKEKISKLEAIKRVNKVLNRSNLVDSKVN